jgi:hypothetical protein
MDGIYIPMVQNTKEMAIPVPVIFGGDISLL